jgi:hypothetical protein
MCHVTFALLFFKSEYIALDVTVLGIHARVKQVEEEGGTLLQGQSKKRGMT